ncbi:MAG: hypothetical protein NT069_32195 [Planctomycetota bacterium]|nr:hypothetical protein [Planctomycetota bacterium]
MASSTLRYPAMLAYRWATEVVTLLAPACERIEIVGSLRRCYRHEVDPMKPLDRRRNTMPASGPGTFGVSDIEILAEPKWEIPVTRTKSLFPDTDKPEARDQLGDLVTTLVSRPDSQLTWDSALMRRGPKYKRLAWRGAKYLTGGAAPAIPIDLFIVTPPASWGCLQAIRTGPAEFSRLLVTSRAKGGALPNHLVAVSGALKNKDGWLQPATEAEYFAAVGLPCWPPAERSAEKLRDWLRRNDSAGEEPQ